MPSFSRPQPDGKPNTVNHVTCGDTGWHISEETFNSFLCRWHWAGRGRCGCGVHAGGGTEVFNDLGVGAGQASTTLLEQLSHERSCVALDQRVLFPPNGLHQGPDHRVELVGEQLQVDHGAGG